MKNYTKPEIEINALNSVDVVTASGGINLTQFKSSKGYTEISDF